MYKDILVDYIIKYANIKFNDANNMHNVIILNIITVGITIKYHRSA